jgi:hypothetical protein
MRNAIEMGLGAVICIPSFTDWFRYQKADKGIHRHRDSIKIA